MNRQLFNLVRTITLISVCWFSVSPPVLADPEEAPPVDSSMQAPSEAPMADAAQAPVAQAPAMTPDNSTRWSRRSRCIPISCWDRF